MRSSHWISIWNSFKYCFDTYQTYRTLQTEDLCSGLQIVKTFHALLTLFSTSSSAMLNCKRRFWVNLAAGDIFPTHWVSDCAHDLVIHYKVYFLLLFHLTDWNRLDHDIGAILPYSYLLFFSINYFGLLTNCFGKYYVKGWSFSILNQIKFNTI